MKNKPFRTVWHPTPQSISISKPRMEKTEGITINSHRKLGEREREGNREGKRERGREIGGKGKRKGE